MVKISIDQIQAIMKSQTQIRNMSICAHVDAGKTTLSDSLVSAAGLLADKEAGDKCAMDTRPDEQARGITIKSTAITLYYEAKPALVANATKVADSAEASVVKPASVAGATALVNQASVDCREIDAKNQFVINMIDSPGHVDFSSEVTSALRVTDGSLVLVDCIDGICVQTQTVLRQALAERIKPVLHINKMDRLIVELNMDSEEIYKRIYNIITEVNSLIATYGDSAVGDIQVYPENGSVSFGSGYHCWAFTLDTYAELLSKATGGKKETMMRKLWGDHFVDPDTGKWYTEPEVNGKKLVRGFCRYILDPIKDLYSKIAKDDLEGVNGFLGKFRKSIKESDFISTKNKKEQTRKVMQQFLPVGESVLNMIVKHLPSPVEAQKYRAELLYTGSMDDKYGQSIKLCDANGPVICYISKMIPTRDNSRFYAFGRVFSGTIRPGRVRVLESDYVPGSKGTGTVPGASGKTVATPSIGKVYLTIAAQYEPVNEIPCGNIVSLQGIDKAITKTATLVEDGETECYPMKDMKYSVSPVVRQAVEPKDPKDLPELIKGMDKLRKSCPLVQCIVDEETKQYIVAAAGELHLEICIKDLEGFVKGSGLKVSDPVVSLRETVTAISSQTCLAKSANKHNRIWAKMMPLGEELCEAIENGTVSANQDPKERAKILVEQFGWEKDAASRIWCFGPDGTGPNIIVDMTKGIQGVAEVKQSIISAWQDYTAKGVLCGEPVRGVRLEIEDLMFHSDNVHRGANQIMPMARKCFKACQLTASPQIQEPIFLAEITTPDSELGKVYGFLNRRRAVVIQEENREGTPMYTVQAHLPVFESFGFTGDLRGVTGGKAFPTMSFSHWEQYPGDPLDQNSNLFGVVEDTRKRKRMKQGNPVLADYLDKL